MSDEHPILSFADDSWEDAISAEDPEYPNLPAWLQRVRDRREGRHG